MTTKTTTKTTTATTPSPSTTTLTGTSTTQTSSEATAVITGSVTLKVADPEAFCGNETAMDAFKSGVADLIDDLDAAWMTAACAPLRRLEAVGGTSPRRLEGVVQILFSIEVPPSEDIGVASAIGEAISASTPAELKGRLDAALAGTGFEVLEVAEIAEPAVEQAMWSVTEGPCTMSGACISSPNYPEDYDNNGFCSISVAPRAGSLLVEDFDTEANWDTLTVNGVRYSGSEIPDVISIITSPTITWTSDSSSTQSGWKICIQEADQQHGAEPNDDSGVDMSGPRHFALGAVAVLLPVMLLPRGI
mmetsp:Transcript_24956/g.62556  ORF Transcript_24956/g.62556 Transcript_24956/m.62556 type:complete len:305 (-) Transcript_24956:78-992(-)